jgi:arginase
MAELVFIGVPFRLGTKEKYSGSVEMVWDSGIAAEFDAEWLMVEPQFDHYDHPVNAINAAVAEIIKQKQGKIPFIIAGDCTVCLGNMKGLEDSSPDVLWVDSHGDFNTPESSPSNFLGGMPLAAMAGHGNQDLMTGIGLDPVPESKIVLTDGRDLDPEEADLVSRSELIHLTKLKRVKNIFWGKRPVYIHFDGDVIRLEDYPAVNYPAKGGPSLEESIEAMCHVINHSIVVGIHFTIWNNDLDGAEKSQLAMMKLIRSLAKELHG